MESEKDTESKDVNSNQLLKIYFLIIFKGIFLIFTLTDSVEGSKAYTH